MSSNNMIDLDKVNDMGKKTLLQSLGIVFTFLDKNKIQATMPVDERTHQVFGILHGGASVALAETIGSVGAQLHVPKDSNKVCVGLEINANHIRAISKGIVTGTGTPLHVGQKTQVWEIKIHNEDGKLVCISRLTVAVVEAL